MLSRLSRYFKDNLVAFLALFVALGGTGAYAANEWNSSNIQDETLTGADVKGRVGTYDDPAVNGSLTTYDIAGQASNAGNGTRFVDGSLTGQDVKDNSLVGADITSLGGSDIADGSLKDEDVGQATFVNLPVNFGTVQPGSCANRGIGQLADQGDHMLLTPADDASSSLDYRVVYNPPNGFIPAGVFLQACNHLDVTVSDDTAHFSLLVFDAQ